MRSIKLAVLYGFLVWLIPFIIAFIIFPIREHDRPLFESIMPVTVTFCAALLSVLYLRKVDRSFLKEGILLGLIWFLISVLIDLPMFSAGPMKMSFGDYWKDIGLTYMIIPIVTVASGYLIGIRTRSQAT